MPLVAWILVGALVASLALCALLYLTLRRSRARAARTEELVTAARRAVRAAGEEESAAQAEQLRIAISRIHADTLSAYATEERRLADERRGELAVRERELSDRLAETLAAVERRVEERLRAWEADLERAQRALDGQVTALAQLQEQRIAQVATRLETEAAELGTTADHQRAAAIRLREELAERLRQREHTLNEQIDRAEGDARARLEIAFSELERRQVEQLDRAATREVDRLSEAGAIEFENRMRAIREEAASRLQQELDKMSESFLRRANMLVADQFQHVADDAAERLATRIDEAARRYEISRAAGPD
jgi:hypothetical protein